VKCNVKHSARTVCHGNQNRAVGALNQYINLGVFVYGLDAVTFPVIRHGLVIDLRWTSADAVYIESLGAPPCTFPLRYTLVHKYLSAIGKSRERKGK
jgi:hypothetical protein